VCGFFRYQLDVDLKTIVTADKLDTSSKRVETRKVRISFLGSMAVDCMDGTSMVVMFSRMLAAAGNLHISTPGVLEDRHGRSVVNAFLFFW